MRYKYRKSESATRPFNSEWTNKYMAKFTTENLYALFAEKNIICVQ
jgi:hypothetical protein